MAKAFKKTDDNLSGALSFEEFQDLAAGCSKKGMVSLHNEELKATWLLLDKGGDGSISQREFLEIAKFPSGDDVIRDLSALVEAVERNFIGENPIHDAFWTPVKMDKGVDVRSLDNHAAHLMSFECFEGAVKTWGFTSQSLPLSDFFSNVFDRTRCGRLSFQDWQLLDFVRAAKQRVSIERFAIFVSTNYKDADIALASLLQQQRRAARRRKLGLK